MCLFLCHCGVLRKKAFPSGGTCAFFCATAAYCEKKPSPRRKRLPPCPSDIPPTGAPWGEGVDQRETDEGSTFHIDVGLCGAVCLPRIKEKPHTLCLYDLWISKPLIRLGVCRATFSSPEAAPPLSFGHSPNGGAPRGRLFLLPHYVTVSQDKGGCMTEN